MSPNMEQLGYSHLQGGEGGEGVKGGGPGSPKGVGGHPGRDAKDYLNIWRVVGFQWCSRLTWLTRTCFATFHTFAGDTGKFLSCCILYLGGFACVKTFSFLPHLLNPPPTTLNRPQSQLDSYLRISQPSWIGYMDLHICICYNKPCSNGIF